MKRTFVATVLAATLGLTSISAAPAHAFDNNAERFLAGVGGLLILGAILDSQRNNNHSTVVRRTPHRPVVSPVRPRDWRALPSVCLRSLRTSSGNWRYMDRRCLAQHAPRAALPGQCLRSVDTHNRDFRAYGAGCLRKNGYTF